MHQLFLLRPNSRQCPKFSLRKNTRHYHPDGRSDRPLYVVYRCVLVGKRGGRLGRFVFRLRCSYLGRDEVEIEIRHLWDRPLGGRYPMGWRITVPYLGLELDVAAVMTAQELSTTVRYWEGAVDVTGSRGGDLLEGRGYVELTGYAQTGGSGPADTL